MSFQNKEKIPIVLIQRGEQIFHHDKFPAKHVPKAEKTDMAAILHGAWSMEKKR